MLSSPPQDTLPGLGVLVLLTARLAALGWPAHSRSGEQPLACQALKVQSLQWCQRSDPPQLSDPRGMYGTTSNHQTDTVRRDAGSQRKQTGTALVSFRPRLSLLQFFCHQFHLAYPAKAHRVLVGLAMLSHRGPLRWYAPILYPFNAFVNRTVAMGLF